MGDRRLRRRRSRAEPGHGLRQAPGLGAAARSRACSAKDVARRAMMALVAHQGGQHLRRAAAARHRARHRDRLRLHAPGSRRPRPREARRRRATSSSGWPPRIPRLVARAAQRHAGRAPVQGRHRLGAGRDARRAGQLDPELPRHGVRRLVRQRLRPGRARQARLRPGRRAVPHAARATSTASTSATTRAASSRSRPSPRAAGSTARRASSATTASPR